MRFTGKNFQSWGNFDIEVSGLTVLTGPSDTGKSAIFRALRGIFYNDLSEAFIRYDSEGMELTADWEGHVITATRTPEESTKYVIDGKKFAKLGGKRPQELKDLGFNPIRIGDTELDPIFAPQFSAQFLIQGTSPTELNNILGGFASTEKLEYGKREANLRITQKNSEAKTLAGEVHDAQTRQAAFEEKIALATPLFNGVESLEFVVSAAEGQLEVLHTAMHHRTELRPLRAVLEKLQIPDLQGTDNIAARVRHLREAFAALSNWQRLSQTRETVDQCSKFWQEVKRLYYGMEASRELSKLHEEINRQKQLGTTLSVILDSANSSSVTSLIDSIKLVKFASNAGRELELSRGFEVRLTAELTAAQAEEHAKQHEIEASRATSNLVTCPECGAQF
jgi:energy-coupling factor transporter ATP-binding protein EcfA2